MLNKGMQKLEKGYHIVIDAISQDSERLRDKNIIDQIICDVIEKIGMRLIDGPHSVLYTDCPEKDSGVSSVAILAESSITIHTYPETGYLGIDLFSCKPFDEKALMIFFRERLSINHYRIVRLQRGSQTIKS